MPKKSPLMMKVAFQPRYAEAVRIIGYNGCEPFEFWDKAKEMGLPKERLWEVVLDLTRMDRRAASPPRYELDAEARQAAWQVLGPPPEHPDYASYHPELAAKGETPGETVKNPKPKRSRGKGRS